MPLSASECPLSALLSASERLPDCPPSSGTASDKISAMVGDISWHVKPRMGEYILLHKDEGHKVTSPHMRPCMQALGTALVYVPPP